MFYSKSCEFLKKSLFTEHLRTTASIYVFIIIMPLVLCFCLLSLISIQAKVNKHNSYHIITAKIICSFQVKANHLVHIVPRWYGSQINDKFINKRVRLFIHQTMCQEGKIISTSTKAAKHQ